MIEQTEVISPEVDVSTLRENLHDLERKLNEIDDQIQIDEDRLKVVKAVIGDFSDTFGRTFAGGEVQIRRNRNLTES